MKASGDSPTLEKDERPASSRRAISATKRVRRGQGTILAPPLYASLLVILSLSLVLLTLRRPGPDTVDLTSYPWLYEREGRPLSSDEEVVEVILVGDVMLGRNLAVDRTVFDAVSAWLRPADLAVANLECVVAPGPPQTASAGAKGESDPLRAPPAAVAMLREAGLDVLGLANNHTLDLGPQGLSETLRHLEGHGLVAIGVGSDPLAALDPLIRDFGAVRLALVGINAISDSANHQPGSTVRAEWDPDLAQRAVRRASLEAEAVIVSIHWGYEYERSVDPAQERAARLLLEAGADLVVGHHPHVVQRLDMEDGRCVAYSLGNFVFDQGQRETQYGLALRAFFDAHGLRALQGLPVWSGCHPRLMSPGEALTNLPTALKPPQSVSYSCTHAACRPTSVSADGPAGKRTAVFFGGSVDLTGDGVAEHVRREADRVIIYSEGVPVWRSPVEWRVVDLALGDPNADGRREIMLALWKPGLDGLEPPGAWDKENPRSRPFIIGYRGGIYRTLWGGSAVRDPILEVELGDVDGDGAEELVVLEAPDDDPLARRIAVWRWHGWGFSLVWRSECDGYSDLIVSEEGTMHALIE